MSLYQLKTREEWADFLSWVAQQVRMAATLCDAQGQVLQVQGEQSPLCEVVRQSEGLMRLVCGQPDSEIFARMRQQLEPVVSLCEVGLMRVFVPILREGQLLGAVSACSLIPRGEGLDLLGVARQFNVSEEQLETLVGTSPYRTEADIKRFAQQLFEKVNALC